MEQMNTKKEKVVSHKSFEAIIFSYLTLQGITSACGYKREK